MTTDKETVFDYLDGLRESGVTNMYGAGAYLEAEFGMSADDAKKLLLEWMRSFKERHPVQ